MAAPTRHDDALDRAVTTPARLACATIGLEPLPIISLSTFDVNVVAETRPLKVNRPAQNLFERLIEPTKRSAGKPAGLGEGMNPRRKEGLVRINIPQAGEASLIEKPTFHRAAPGARGLEKLRLGHLLRVGSKPPKNRLQFLQRAGAQPAEAASITESDFLFARVERQANVSVRLKRLLAPTHGELARHAQAHHQEVHRSTILSFKRERQHLPLALNGSDPSPANPTHKAGRRTHEDPRMQDFNFADLASENALPKPSGNGFDFW